MLGINFSGAAQPRASIEKPELKTDAREDKEYFRYSLFIGLLPVFFIAPLALFSMLYWWRHAGLSSANAVVELMPVASVIAAPVDPEVSLVQWIFWLLYTLCCFAAFFTRRLVIMLLGYMLLIGSMLLQWQLPVVIETFFS